MEFLLHRKNCQRVVKMCHDEITRLQYDFKSRNNFDIFNVELNRLRLRKAYYDSVRERMNSSVFSLCYTKEEKHEMWKLVAIKAVEGWEKAFNNFFKWMRRDI